MEAMEDHGGTSSVIGMSIKIEIPDETLSLWKEVASGLDTNQTVVRKNALNSLDSAKRFIESPIAQDFVERYLNQMISILSIQIPSKIGVHERDCVQASLTYAVQIVAYDLALKVTKKKRCTLFSTLSSCFNKQKTIYKGAKGSPNEQLMRFLPSFRLKVIECFREVGGFKAFNEYLALTIGTEACPGLDVLRHILEALKDSASSRLVRSPQVSEEDAIAVSKTAMSMISAMNDEDLETAVLPVAPQDLLGVLRGLQGIFDSLVDRRREAVNDFYDFWRAVALKMIKSQSPLLKSHGEAQIVHLVDAAQKHKPPPRAVIVSGAGLPICNGKYTYAGETTADGYQKWGSETLYCRQVPNDLEFGENAGKTLTVFRCIMRSGQKWWFISHANEDQPATDRDIDYYQHKSKGYTNKGPPAVRWCTCRAAGVDPPPTIVSEGVLVPTGQERNTLWHHLVDWSIGNKLVADPLLILVKKVRGSSSEASVSMSDDESISL